MSKNVTLVLVIVMVILCGELSLGQDPAGSWLAYTISRGNGAKLTSFNCTWTVPSNPTEDGGFPAFWMGIEPSPALNLLQPILKWEGSSWQIFVELFIWKTGYDFQSAMKQVSPGGKVFASVVYNETANTYVMKVQDLGSGWSITHPYKVPPGVVFEDAYVVVEHQPSDCSQYPASNSWQVDDLAIELEGKPVTPQWEAHLYRPACNITASVLSPTSVRFDWQS